MLESSARALPCVSLRSAAYYLKAWGDRRPLQSRFTFGARTVVTCPLNVCDVWFAWGASMSPWPPCYATSSCYSMGGRRTTGCAVSNGRPRATPAPRTKRRPFRSLQEGDRFSPCPGDGVHCSCRRLEPSANCVYCMCEARVDTLLYCTHLTQACTVVAPGASQRICPWGVETRTPN